jgi:hypothetical protein
LPNGIFSDQKSQFCFIFGGLGIKNLGIFYCHFGTFKFLWCILPPFCGNLVFIFPFLCVASIRIWQPWLTLGRPDEIAEKIAQNVVSLSTSIVVRTFVNYSCIPK